MADGFTIVDPPLAAPPRLGLHVSANRPDPGDARWQLGLKYTPETCTEPSDLEQTHLNHAWWSACAGPTGAEGDPEWTVTGPSHSKGAGPAQGDVEFYLPIQHTLTDRCKDSTVDVQARVRRRHAANLPRLVEHELWTGEVARTAGMPNRFLASTDAEVVGNVSGTPLKWALAELGQYIADHSTSRGMIHCDVRTYMHWWGAQLLRREGAVVLDAMDNIVVPGTGYPGTAPLDPDSEESTGEDDFTGDTAWAYATSMVQWLQDPTPQVVFSIDRATNERMAIAEQYVATFFDGCAHAACLVDLCQTACAPGLS